MDLTTIGIGVGAFLGVFALYFIIAPKLSKAQKENAKNALQLANEISKTVVLAVKNDLEGKSGPEKKAEAVKRVKAILAELGIKNVSDTLVSNAIEWAYDILKMAGYMEENVEEVVKDEVSKA